MSSSKCLHAETSENPPHEVCPLPAFIMIFGYCAILGLGKWVTEWMAWVPCDVTCPGYILSICETSAAPFGCISCMNVIKADVSPCYVSWFSFLSANQKKNNLQINSQWNQLFAAELLRSVGKYLVPSHGALCLAAPHGTRREASVGWCNQSHAAILAITPTSWHSCLQQLHYTTLPDFLISLSRKIRMLSNSLL